MMINNANRQAGSPMVWNQWQEKMTHETQQWSHWISLFFKARTRRTASFSYLKHGAIHFTPCDYLNDLGGIETFWTNSIVYCDLFNSSCRALGEKAEQGIGEPQNSNSPEGVGEKKTRRATPPRCRTLLLCAVESLPVDVSLCRSKWGMSWHITTRAALQRVA